MVKSDSKKRVYRLVFVVLILNERHVISYEWPIVHMVSIVYKLIRNSITVFTSVSTIGGGWNTTLQIFNFVKKTPKQ